MIDESSRESGTGKVERDPSQFTPRAPRFPIVAPLLYRTSGSDEWSEGTTINISRSGILFRAGQDLALETPLDMQIVFPPEVTGETPAKVSCWGPVVRKVPPAGPEDRPALAAAISRYRFAHD